jgi:hypothetical protein
MDSMKVAVLECGDFATMTSELAVRKSRTASVRPLSGPLLALRSTSKKLLRVPLADGLAQPALLSVTAR